MTKTSKIMSTTASTTSISPKRTLFASEKHGNPLEHTTPTKSLGSPGKDTPARLRGASAGGFPKDRVKKEQRCADKPRV